jgi:type IX secretion system protein PorV
MRKFLVVIAIGGLILQGVGRAWASGPGTTAADILKIGVGARAIGMGEAYVAQADDVSSLYWNPAGLALMQERQASFMYDQMYQDLKFQNANIGIPLENGAIGGSLSYLSYGDIQGFDQSGVPTGNQSAYSGVATLGAAWLGDQWSAGVNAKGIQEKLADETANDAAFDIGGNVIYPKPVLGGTLRFGAVAQNLGSSMKFEQQSDPLPMDWKVGVAAVQLMDRRLNVSLDYTTPKDDSGFVSSGFEYWLVPFIALRAGYVNSKTEGSGMRAGIGIRYKGVSFDYAYAGQGELGLSHRYELSFRFGEPRPILTSEERKILQQAKAAMRQQRYEQATLLFDSLIELEPRYQPARRYIKVAMAKLEGQQAQMVARQGKVYQPGVEGGTRKPALPEMDDLEQLLNLGTPKSAQTPGAGADNTATPPAAQQEGGN